MSSQWGSQKWLQGFVSHELSAYLSIFNLIKLNELWPYYQKHVNQIILNRTTLWSSALQIFKAFVQILLISNLSLNETLLTFWLCVRQTWMTHLVNSAIIFLSQMALLRWLTFLLTSQSVILIVLLFWIYLFLLTLVVVLQWLYLHWEILIILLSQIPLTFHQILNGMPRFIA